MGAQSKTFLAFVLLAMLCAAAPLIAEPGPSAAPLELQANLAFNRGQYKAALPLLQKLAESYQGDPARQGPIKEKIKVCETAIASLKSAPPATQPAAVVTYKDRRPHTAPKPGEVLEMSIKDLGNFDYDPEHGLPLPADVSLLNGATIRLRGFMNPIDQAEAITEFALVPSLFTCCNGGPPQVQHTIIAHCPKGKAVGYYPDELIVEGKLTVKETKDDGYVVSIFDLAVTSVKPAPPQ
jgi:hypothetical protein